MRNLDVKDINKLNAFQILSYREHVLRHREYKQLQLKWIKEWYEKEEDIMGA